MGDTTATFASITEPAPPDECFEGLGPDGEPPTCEWDGTAWVTVYEDVGLGDPGFGDPGFGAASAGVPPVFVALMVLVVAAGIATTLWRLSLARKMAVESGLDPDRATAMTMLSDDGLEATYLASSLRQQATPASPSAAVEGRSVEERLRELQSLRDQGLVTYDEYDARRRAIIDSL